MHICQSAQGILFSWNKITNTLKNCIYFSWHILMYKGFKLHFTKRQLTKWASYIFIIWCASILLFRNNLLSMHYNCSAVAPYHSYSHGFDISSPGMYHSKVFSMLRGWKQITKQGLVSSLILFLNTNWCDTKNRSTDLFYPTLSRSVHMQNLYYTKALSHLIVQHKWLQHIW